MLEELIQLYESMNLDLFLDHRLTLSIAAGITIAAFAIYTLKYILSLAGASVVRALTTLCFIPHTLARSIVYKKGEPRNVHQTDTIICVAFCFNLIALMISGIFILSLEFLTGSIILCIALTTLKFTYIIEYYRDQACLKSKLKPGQSSKSIES